MWLFRKKKQYNLDNFSKDLQIIAGKVCDFFSKEMESTLDITYTDKDGKKTVKTEKKNALVHIVRLLVEIKNELVKLNAK